MAFAFDFGGPPVEVASKPVESAPLRPACQVVLDESIPPPRAWQVLVTDDEDECLRFAAQTAINAVTEEMADVTEHSDLVPNVYEGGFKLWECAVDLIKYLRDKAKEGDPFLTAGGRVAELGCGHGLPGILALQKGAAVDFFDYNAEVLRGLTIPNVVLNLNSHDAKARFFAGDWSAVSDMLHDKEGRVGYDVILTSDSIYAPSSYRSLIAFLDKHLSDSGVAFVAAKAYYFGVGGSVDEFSSAVTKTGTLGVEKVCEIADGVSNVRQILAVKRIQVPQE